MTRTLEARPVAGRPVGSGVGGAGFARVGLRAQAPAGAAHPRHGARLTRRGRVVVTLVVLVLLVVGFSVGRVSSQAAGPATNVAPRTVTVHAGETLWQVAQRVAPHVDPRVVVAQIEQRNHLAGGEVQAGQQIVVPRAR